MPVRTELTIMVESESELHPDLIQIMGRNAAALMLREHGAEAAYSNSRELTSASFRGHRWPSTRFPGEGREWAVTEVELSNWISNHEYDDDEEDLF